MMISMQRVIVIGCPGTGKTTFAVQLAKLTSLPLEHLDFYYHDDQYDYQHNRLAWREKVTELVSPNRWIIEGNYKSTLDVRLPWADTIIYFDYPRRIAVWRSLKRRILNHRKPRPGMPSNWREKITPEFARIVWQFNTRERPRIYELINQYKSDKTATIFKSPLEAQAYLEALNQVHP
jgi:adenylate kinase family enzyme